MYLSYTQVKANATIMVPQHCAVIVSLDEITELNPNETFCIIVMYQHVTCTASNSVLVSDPSDSCRPCSLKWTGCEDWSLILLDYVALGPFVLVTIDVQNVSEAFSVKLRTLVTSYPLDESLQRIPVSPTFGEWLSCFQCTDY